LQSETIPSDFQVQELDIQQCIACNSGCKINEENSFCETHGLTSDSVVGHHFCLSHQLYHCYDHYRQCRKKYGTSVMAVAPQTLYQIQRRAQQIIAEQAEELVKMERWMDQIKHGRFICAECRQVCCVCNIDEWKTY